jgi:lysosomal acid lipase/cholesteryl ester hydrolase
MHRVTDGNPQGKPVVYCHHGLMTSSELWVVGDSTERCLPFQLVDQGYDVWLGNNRGNKYSQGHTTLSMADIEYWNFSIDEFALHDIPCMINYVLTTTNQESLRYVGFSQGSSQLFAALSKNKGLNKKIEHFTALSPVMIPQRLKHPAVEPLVLNPHYIGYIFGSGPLLPFVHMVNDWMPPDVFNKIIDVSLQILFQWCGSNITLKQKASGYPYLYSVSSVKSVMHWFQIIRDQKFQSYDQTSSEAAEYNTENITTPVLLIYGDADCLVDIEKTYSLLECDKELVRCESYEHMDTLWGENCVEKVFNVILDRYRQLDERPISLGSVFI